MNKAQLSSAVETITPNIANEWLALAGPNRKIDWKTVARYARLMKEGLWALDGMTIKWGWDGRLIDGQHRLHAVARSGVTIQSVVVRGLDPATFDTMDRGRMRSVGQALSTKGMRNGTALASAALTLYHDQQGAMNRSWNLRLEPRELAAIVAAHPGLHEAVAAVKSGCAKLHCNTGAVAWCYYRFHSADALLADAFFHALFTGESLKRGDPVFLLRERLIENAGARAKLNAKDVCALIVKTWNAVIEGREVRQLKAPRRTDGAEPFPTLSTRKPR